METNVSFDEPSYAPTRQAAPKTNLLAKAVISLGLAKDEQGAQTVLLLTALVCLGAAVVVAFMGGVIGGGAAPTPMILE